MNEKLNALLKKTNIVAVIASEKDASVALDNPDTADIFEWRVDYSSSIITEDAMKELARLNRPIIVTVRDAKEGGKQASWGVEERTALYRLNMPLATFVDIEASTADSLKDVIVEAKKADVGIIISQHFFQNLWFTALVDAGLKTYRKFGGDIFKVALLPNDNMEFADFIKQMFVMSQLRNICLAPMAMGDKFGKVSRLLFAQNGSPLVYGHLGEAHVRGQWHVKELRDLLNRLE